eukprot:3193708-Prorocentrum_lima.AAC.1
MVPQCAEEEASGAAGRPVGTACKGSVEEGSLMEEGGERAVGRKGMGGSVDKVSAGPVNMDPGIADSFAASEE